MTIAQHASNILEACKFDGQRGLGAALDSASRSGAGEGAASGWESERSELLESIVDHLRQLASRNEVPNSTGRSGALALLSHLSSTAGAVEAAVATKAEKP